MRTRSPSRNKDTREDTEIYVGNINAQTPVEPDDLKRLFGIAGQVTNVRIEKSNSKDTHFAFISFATVDEAERGCLYDGFKYHALSLKVQRKGRPGPPKPSQPPSEVFTQKLRELQEQENTDLYLTNLNTADASEDVLHETFSAFGDVRRVHLHGDPNNLSRPAFITFSRPEQVQRAVDAMDGKEFLGNTLGVCKARVGQRFWAIEAAAKASKDRDRGDGDKRGSDSRDDRGTRGKGESSGKRTAAPSASSASKDDKSASRSDPTTEKERKRRQKEKEEKPARPEEKKEEKSKAAPPKTATASPAPAPTAASSSSTAAAAPAQAKPSEKAASPAPAASASSAAPAAAKKQAAAPAPAAAPAAAPSAAPTAAAATVPRTAAAAAAAPAKPAPPAQPPTLFPPPSDPSDPVCVAEAVLVGLQGTRIADKEKNIGLHCSTDSHGVPTMVLPTAGERVCNALHTVAQAMRREIQKMRDQAEESKAALARQLEEAQQQLAASQQETASVKQVMQETCDELLLLRNQKDQFASLRLLNVKSDVMGKDIANMCNRYGPVQHVAMLGATAHVTFSTKVNITDIASQLSSQQSQQAEACFHSALVVQDVAKQPAPATPVPVAQPAQPQPPVQPQPQSQPQPPQQQQPAQQQQREAHQQPQPPQPPQPQKQPQQQQPQPQQQPPPAAQSQPQQQRPPTNPTSPVPASQAAPTRPPAGPVGPAASAPASAPAPAPLNGVATASPGEQFFPMGAHGAADQGFSLVSTSGLNPHASAYKGPPGGEPQARGHRGAAGAQQYAHTHQPFAQQAQSGGHMHHAQQGSGQHHAHPHHAHQHQHQHQHQQQQQPQPQQQQQQPPQQQQQPQQQGRPQTPQQNICIVCGRTGYQVCSVCMMTYYCGSECQASHWPSHMNECEILKQRRETQQGKRR